MHDKKPTQELIPFGEKVLARPLSSEPLNRMSPRYKFGVWLGVRNDSAEGFVETEGGVFGASEIRRIEHQNRWEKEAINSVIGVPWRIVDGNWTVDRPATHIDPLPPPPVLERITRTDIEAFGTTAGCPVCNAMESEHNRVRIEEWHSQKNKSR